MRRLLPLGQAVTGSAHVTACVFLAVAYFSTGHWVPLAGSCVAGVCAWWLLKDDEDCAHDWDDIEVRAFGGTRLHCRLCGKTRG